MQVATSRSGHDLCLLVLLTRPRVCASFQRVQSPAANRVKSETVTRVNVNIAILWTLTPCRDKLPGVSCCLQIHDRGVSFGGNKQLPSSRRLSFHFRSRYSFRLCLPFFKLTLSSSLYSTFIFLSPPPFFILIPQLAEQLYVPSLVR